MGYRGPGFESPAYVRLGRIAALEEDRAALPFTGTGGDFRTAPGQPAESQTRRRGGAGLPGPIQRRGEPPFGARRPAPARIGGIVDRVSYGDEGALDPAPARPPGPQRRAGDSPNGVALDQVDGSVRSAARNQRGERQFE